MEYCPQCGAGINPGSPEGLCAACLFAGGLPLSGESETKLTTRITTGASSDPQAALEPDSFGPYRIVRALGEGGMGSVYLAEQTHPIQRPVALKVIKAGLNTAEILSRFAYERQALAMMDHPNIARVYDAGVTEKGRPYFVMEYIDGVPITQYCDTQRLNTRERLQLFVPVCQAVQHAHSKGVLHRDIKPSNVLVMQQDGHASPKVIDFGIARAIDQRTAENVAFTKLGELVGTPEYMSPEQADLASNDIDTSSDVYSLGVLLYELLVGVVPFESAALRKAGLAELLRIIREEEAPALPSKLTGMGQTGTRIAAQRRTDPGSLKRQLSGDLNWIVMKAMEKDRRRRYPSASEFAGDIHRHLEGFPVLAGPPDRLYQMGKFIRRHKVPVASGLLMAASLVAGMIGVVREAHIAELRRQEAETQRSHAVEQGQIAVSERRRAEGQSARAQEQRQIAIREQNRADEQRQIAENQRDANRRLLYGAEMNLAMQAWESNQFDRTEELLRKYLPKPGEEDMRGLEWYYFWRQSQNERATLPLQASGVAFSPDGKLLAIGQQGTITLFDLAAGKEFGKLPTADESAEKLAFSPDGKLLFGNLTKVGGGIRGPQSVVFWDVASQRRIANWETRIVIAPLAFNAFSTDGTKLAFVEQKDQDRRIRVVEVRGGHELFASPIPGRGFLTSLALSPDGARLAAGRVTGAIAMFDVTSGRELFAVNAHSGGFNCMSFSPDGHLLATACGSDRVTKVWDTASGSLLNTLSGHTGRISSMGFSPDGQLLATIGSDATRIWQVSTGKQMASLRTGTGFSFSPDGHLLAVVGTDTVRIWDVTPAPEFLKSRPVLLTMPVRLTFSPDGKSLLMSLSVLSGGRPSEVRLWNVQTGGELPIGASADGQRPATAPLWNLPGLWNQFQRILPKPASPPGTQTEIMAMALSPDGATLIAGQDDGLLQVWNAATGQVVREIQVFPDRRPNGIFGSRHGINCIAFAPDGKTFVTGDSTVTIWDRATLKPRMSLHPAGGFALDATYDRTGRYLAIGQGQTARILDVTTGRERVVLDTHGNAAAVVSFSADGSRLLTAGGDSTVRIWQISSGQEILTLHGTTGIRSVGVSPVGDAFATVDFDRTIRLWRLATPRSVEAQLKNRTLGDGLKGIRAAIVQWENSPGNPIR